MKTIINTFSFRARLTSGYSVIGSQILVNENCYTIVSVNLTDNMDTDSFNVTWNINGDKKTFTGKELEHALAFSTTLGE
jgi:hypothetical protein